MPTKSERPPRKTQRTPEDIGAAIRSEGFDWVAGTTPLTNLSAQEQKDHLGLVVSDAELKATEAAIKAQEALSAIQATAIAAPPAVDWRNKSGNWVTGIKDQNSCGSCVSFGTVSTIESRMRIAQNNANLAIDLSEAHLFYCGCGNCCGTGWNFVPALDFCKNTGVGLETSFPYTPGNQPCRAGVTPYVKITSYAAVLAVADRKNVLSTKGPMVAGMAVYQDFFSYRSGVYRHATGNLAGYHCVSVIGYDDTQSCWICKNSWGAGWGDQGFFRIGYGEAGIDTQFAFYDVDVPRQPRPTDVCQQYLAALRRAVEMAYGNPSLRLCLRYYVCGRPPRPLCSPAHLNVVRAVMQILRVCPQYRVPFCRALG